MKVPLTRDFKETIMKEMRARAGLRKAMLCEAIDCFLHDEPDIAKSILRDIINATMGFEALADAIGLPSKSLMRMLGPNGNPQAKNLFAVITFLQKDAGITLEVAAKPIAKRRAHSAPRTDKKKSGSPVRARLSRASPTIQPGFAEKPTRFKRR